MQAAANGGSSRQHTDVLLMIGPERGSENTDATVVCSKAFGAAAVNQTPQKAEGLLLKNIPDISIIVNCVTWFWAVVWCFLPHRKQED